MLCPSHKKKKTCEISKSDAIADADDRVATIGPYTLYRQANNCLLLIFGYSEIYLYCYVDLLFPMFGYLWGCHTNSAMFQCHDDSRLFFTNNDKYMCTEY